MSRTPTFVTSDGIRADDWGKVERLASEIARFVQCDQSEQALAVTSELVAYLGVLEAHYGRLPSILATRADYLEETDERAMLLEEAYNLAAQSNDAANCTAISSSLAQLFIEDAGAMEEGKKWLSILADALARHWDDFEHQEYSRLTRIAKLHE